jgi:hypothetical protein
MQGVTKLILGIFILLGVNMVFTAAASFMNISPELYMNYLFWFDALTVLWMFLPDSVGTMFA